MHVLITVALVLLIAIPTGVSLAVYVGLEAMRATAYPPEVSIDPPGAPDEGLAPLFSADVGPSTVPVSIAHL